MLRYEHNDDGMFQRGYRIYDGDHKIYADAEREEDAREICLAVNTMRGLIKDEIDTIGGCIE